MLIQMPYIRIVELGDLKPRLAVVTHLRGLLLALSGREKKWRIYVIQ